MSGEGVLEDELLNALFFFLDGIVDHVGVLGGGIVIIIIFILVVIVLVVIIQIVGDDIDAHRVNLDDLEFGFTLDAVKDFALFHFVFVDVDFNSAFWAADHGPNPPVRWTATEPASAII
jgi:hypothetical protein